MYITSNSDMNTTTKEAAMDKTQETRVISRAACAGEAAERALIELEIKARNLPSALGVHAKLEAEVASLRERIGQIARDLDFLVFAPEGGGPERFRLANRGKNLIPVCQGCGHRPEGPAAPPDCEECEGTRFEMCEDEEHADHVAENVRTALPIRARA